MYRSSPTWALKQPPPPHARKPAPSVQNAHKHQISIGEYAWKNARERGVGRNNNNNNHNHNHNNNKDKEQTITGAPSFFFVSTLFYKQASRVSSLFDLEEDAEFDVNHVFPLQSWASIHPKNPLLIVVPE